MFEASSKMPNVILNLKKGYNITLKNLPPVSGDLLRISWK